MWLRPAQSSKVWYIQTCGEKITWNDPVCSWRTLQFRTTECIRHKHTEFIPGRRQCPRLPPGRTGCQCVTSYPAVSHKSDTSWRDPVRQRQEGNHIAWTASADTHRTGGAHAPLSLITDCTCAGLLLPSSLLILLLCILLGRDTTSKLLRKKTEDVC